MERLRPILRSARAAFTHRESWPAALAALGLSQVLTMAASLVVARSLSAEGFGTVSVARNFLMLAAVIFQLGLDLGLQRRLGEVGERAGEHFAEIRLLRLICAVAALSALAILGLGGAGLAESYVIGHQGFSRILLVTMIALPFWVDLAVMGGAYRGILRPGPSLFAMSVIQPAVRLAATVVSILLGEVLLAMPIGLICGYGAAWMYLAARASRQFALPPGRASYDFSAVAHVLRFSIPLAFAIACTTLTRMLDLLALSYFAPRVEVGRYSATLLLVQMLLLVGAAKGQAIGTRVASAFARRDTASLQSALMNNIRLIGILAAPLFACFLFWGGRLDLLIGDSYRQDGLVVILAVTYGLIASVWGSFGLALAMTNHYKIETAIIFAGLLIQAAGCLVLVPNYGQAGAAAASLVTTVAILAMRCIAVHAAHRIFLQLEPLLWIGAALAIAALVFAVETHIGGRTVLSTAISCIATCAVYLLLTLGWNRYGRPGDLR